MAELLTSFGGTGFGVKAGERNGTDVILPISELNLSPDVTIQNGDIFVLCAFYSGATTDITFANNGGVTWTELPTGGDTSGTTCRLHIHTYTVTGGVIPGDVTIDGSGNAAHSLGAVAFVVNAEDQTIVMTTAAGVTGTSATPDSPSVTAPASDSLAVSVVGIKNLEPSPTQPSGYTYDEGGLRGGNESAETSNASCNVAFLNGVAAGAVNPGAWSGFTSADWIAVTVIFSPQSAVSHVGEARFAGAGSMSAQATNRKPGAATFSGAGSFSAQATNRKFGEATFNGAGSFSAQATNRKSGAATFSGAGSFSTQATTRKFGEAIFSGTGGLSALARQRMLAFATFNGAGSQSINVNARMLASAIFAGEGTFSADAVVVENNTQFIEAVFAGQGGMSAEARALQAIQALFAGEGSLSALARQTQIGAALFEGAGSFSGYARLNLAAFASFAGNSTFSVNLDSPFLRLEAIFNGAGSFSAQARLNQVISARFEGVGDLSAYGRLRMQVAATLNGEGGLSGTLLQRMRAEAQFAGASALSIDSTVVEPSTTSFIAGVFGGRGGFIVDTRIVPGAIPIIYDYPLGHGLYSDYGIRASATMYKQRLVIGRR